ncbi:uncharacterized protein EHS24_000206 [Apiotrichum porosum]|uniref:Uncharacterized protein n=1 Tax=Apiotrichum porosum TaxID=105984 RepID=A0A427Y966_9TREE|nr:uncharacterized protein EHS24_000206 [Apiotrichum porosum]RSH87690.1 hypothetical protein EHS24_000206 [Apiotrichum porosum]
MVDNFAACGLIDTVQLKPFALNKATRVEYNFNGLSDPAIEMLFGIPDPVVLACRDPYGPHVKQEERDTPGIPDGPMSDLLTRYRTLTLHQRFELAPACSWPAWTRMVLPEKRPRRHVVAEDLDLGAGEEELDYGKFGIVTEECKQVRFAVAPADKSQDSVVAASSGEQWPPFNIIELCGTRRIQHMPPGEGRLTKEVLCFRLAEYDAGRAPESWRMSAVAWRPLPQTRRRTRAGL